MSRRRKAGFATRDDAERVLAKIHGDLALGSAGLPPDPRTAPKLADAVDDFLRRRKSTHRAGAEDGYRWKKHLAPHLGHLRPAEVDHARLRDFIMEKRAEGLTRAPSASSSRSCRRCLTS